MKRIIIAIAVVGFVTVQTLWAQQPIKLKAILEVADTIPNAQLGAIVKGVGDLNHDGYTDVAVSAPGLFKTYIYYGGKTMSQKPSLTLEGGGQIAPGDFRGNGWTDLAIEIANHDTVLVYFNGPSGLDTIPDLVLTQPSRTFGERMTSGDFFGSGYTDLAVLTMDDDKLGTPLYQRGRVFVYAGGSSGLDTTAVDTIAGDTANAGLGRNGLSSGDVYANGKDELIALGFNQSCGTLSCAYNYISVYSNHTGYSMNRSLYIDFRRVPGAFAITSDDEANVACLDADGDGIKDILINGIFIFKGASKIDTLPTYRVGPPDNDTAAYGAYPWVGGGGDYNGDGIPDILLASQRGGGFFAPGVFVMVDGRGHPGQYMGYRVYSDYLGGDVELNGNPENAGDVNGGGVDDIIIGNGGWPYPDSYGFFGIYSGDTSMVAAVKERKAPPKQFNLEQNYPNPFNPSTAISYQLSEVSCVTLKIYDTLGREVVTLIDNERQLPGAHTVYWDGANNKRELVSSGTYFYQLTTGTGRQTKKALYLK